MSPHQLYVVELLVKGEVPGFASQAGPGDTDLAPVAASIVGVAVVRLDQLGLVQ